MDSPFQYGLSLMKIVNAAIIEGLIAQSYLIREGRELIPTAKASQLLTLLKGLNIETLSEAELTGEWEYKLSQIEKGQLSRKDFILRHLAQLPLDVRQDQPEYREILLAQLQLLPDQGRRLFRRVTIIKLFIVFVLDIQRKIAAIQRGVPCTNFPPPSVNLSGPRNNA